jgi:hypothetical protein
VEIHGVEDGFFFSSLEIENFKPFGERVKVPLASITLLFGENSAGKSSILQCLYMLKQTLENGPSSMLLPRATKGIVDLGRFKDLIFDHDLSRDLIIKLSLGLRPDDKEEEFGGMEWKFRQASEEDDIGLHSFTVFEEGKSICSFTLSQPKDRQGHKDPAFFSSAIYQSAEVFWRDNHRSMKFDERNRIFRPDLSSLDKDCISKKYYAELFQKIFKPNQFSLQEAMEMQEKQFVVVNNAYLPVGWGLENFKKRELARKYLYGLFPSNSADFYSEVVEDILKHLYPLGPFRQSPQRTYMFSGASPSDLGYSGEKLPEYTYRNPDGIKYINDWLSRLEVGYEFSVLPLGDRSKGFFEICLRNSRGVEHSLADVGFGVSQILPIIVQTVSGSGQTIAVEQPEVHIHPRLQAELGDLFAAGVKNFYNRYIIETHSEHLVLRLQKLISLGELKPDDVSVLYVSRGKNGSIVQRLNIDEDGDFMDDWPGGFFPERLRELR